MVAPMARAGRAPPRSKSPQPLQRLPRAAAWPAASRGIPNPQCGCAQATQCNESQRANLICPGLVCAPLVEGHILEQAQAPGISEEFLVHGELPGFPGPGLLERMRREKPDPGSLTLARAPQMASSSAQARRAYLLRRAEAVAEDAGAGRVKSTMKWSPSNSTTLPSRSGRM